jgi:hypothetical protein
MYGGSELAWVDVAEVAEIVGGWVVVEPGSSVVMMLRRCFKI